MPQHQFQQTGYLDWPFFRTLLASELVQIGLVTIVTGWRQAMAQGRKRKKQVADDLNSIGDWVRRKRKEYELTQAELAERLSVYQPDIADLEAGRHLPDVEKCVALARVFGVDVRDIFNVISKTETARRIEAAEKILDRA